MTRPPEPPRFGLPENFETRVPEGDSLPRSVCNTCGHIHYVNPKIVAGTVIELDGRYLLARRAIHPRRGFWTIAAGYLEEHESAESGAAREAFEEAGARVAIERLLAVYSVPRISQVQLIYRARLTAPDVAPGVESLELGWFSYDQIPWSELAFPSVHWALTQNESVRGREDFPPFTNPASGPGTAG